MNWNSCDLIEVEEKGDGFNREEREELQGIVRFGGLRN